MRGATKGEARRCRVMRTMDSPLATGVDSTRHGPWGASVIRSATRPVRAPFAILALLTRAVHGDSLLHEQFDGCSGLYPVSQYVVSDPYYEFRIADDFIVPPGADWSISQVAAEGGFFGGGFLPASFDVYFYDDASGSPGAALAACANPATSYNNLLDFFVVSLATPCVLSGGATRKTYWVSLQARVPDVSFADWGWHSRALTSGNASRIEYPGGVKGDACKSWRLKSDCLASESPYPDQCFGLAGDSPVIFANDFDGPAAGH